VLLDGLLLHKLPWLASLAWLLLLGRLLPWLAAGILLSDEPMDGVSQGTP
jgi:hypothetical protein